VKSTNQSIPITQAFLPRRANSQQCMYQGIFRKQIGPYALFALEDRMLWREYQHKCYQGNK